MPEFENSVPTTNSTLAQLLDVDSQLSTQQAHLQAQLESIQQKRQSLQVVISLFNETGKAPVAALIEETTPTPQEPTQEIPQDVEESQTVVEPEPEPEPQELPIAPPTSTPVTAKKKATSTNKKGQTKKAQSKKAAKPVVGWQDYLKEEFGNSSLPQAISQVIHSDAKRVWDTATVADALFVPEIPVEVKKKVRLQITNLLAQGVKENKWHREQQGSYTIAGKHRRR